MEKPTTVHRPNKWENVNLVAILTLLKFMKGQKKHARRQAALKIRVAGQREYEPSSTDQSRQKCSQIKSQPVE
jgi:hypothetical protein